MVLGYVKKKYLSIRVVNNSKKGGATVEFDKKNREKKSVDWKFCITNDKKLSCYIVPVKLLRTHMNFYMKMEELKVFVWFWYWYVA